MTLEEFKTIQIGDIVEIETKEKLQDMEKNHAKYSDDNYCVVGSMLTIHDQPVAVDIVLDDPVYYNIQVINNNYAGGHYWTHDMIKRIIRRAGDTTRKFEIGDRVMILSTNHLDEKYKMSVGRRGTVTNKPYKGWGDYTVKIDTLYNDFSKTGVFYYTKDQLELETQELEQTTQTIKEEDNKNMEIVELYKVKELRKIEDKKDKAIAELKDASTDYQEVLKLKDKYNIVEINLDCIWSDILNKNDKMVELYKSIINEATEAIKTLKNKVIEVTAMLEICETYEQKIEVLKAHDIIGDDLKLKD